MAFIAGSHLPTSFGVLIQIPEVPVNIVNRLSFFFLVTLLGFLFFISGQLFAGTTLTDAGIKFPDGSVQTTKAVETGVPGPQGPQGPQGDTGASGPAFGVYSNNDQYLGVVMGASVNYVKLFIPSIKMFCSLRAEDCIVGYADLSRTTEYYETTDCTGTPFYGDPCCHSTVASQIFKMSDGSYVYVGQRITKTIKSYKSFDCPDKSWACSTLNEYSLPYYEYYYTYEFVSAPSLPFTTPIQLPLKYEYK